MRKVALLQFVALFGFTGLVQAQALQIVRVQTDDPAGYVAWAADSASALLGGNPGSVSTCLPRFGAEAGVDAYFSASTPDAGSLLALDFNAPAVLRETEKVADSRTVVARDVFLTIKGGRSLEAGDRWSQMALFVETAEPARYVELIGEFEDALHANGFEDVTWAVHTMNSGDYAGLLHVALQAPSGQRLGDALDAASTASWSNFARGEFNGLRKIVRGMFIECTLHAGNR